MTTFINKDMKAYMMKITERVGTIHKKNNIDFSKDIMLYFNKRAKNENYYGYDKYGIIVRKGKAGNEKSPFGWKRNEDNEIVSIHLRQDCPEDVIKQETLIKIQSIFKTSWNNQSNILRKIYERYKNGYEEDDKLIREKTKSSVSKK